VNLIFERDKMGGEQKEKLPYHRLDGTSGDRKCQLKYSDLQRLRTVVVLGLVVFLLMHLIITTTMTSPQQVERLGMIHYEDFDCRKVQNEFQSEYLNLDKNGKVVALNNNGPQGEIVFRPYLNCLHQEDTQLIHIIKQKYIQPPNDKRYSFSVPVGDVKFPSQTKDILDLVYKDRSGVPRDGFFIEAGSRDSETSSVSLEFELKYGWSGLLIEAHPGDFIKGRDTNRKAFQLNSCLGLYNHPHFAMYDFFSAVRSNTSDPISSGGIIGDYDHPEAMQMQCLPLYSIIKAVGFPVVNLLVLDLEGSELMVVKSIPWDKVDIEIISVETDLVGRSVQGGSQSEIREYLDSVGYKRFNHRGPTNPRTGLNQADLFVRSDIVTKYGVTDYPGSSYSSSSKYINKLNL